MKTTSGNFVRLEKHDLDAYEAVFRRLPGLTSRLDPSRLFWLKTRFETQLPLFFAITDILAEYADMSCWCNLNDYYALQETPTPTTDQEIYLYLIENHPMFLDIIANYRDAEGLE